MLRTEALRTAAVRAHQSKMEVGDQVILWEAGKNAGCYALATIVSAVAEIEVLKIEKDYYKAPPELDDRVHLKIDYNLWNKPITEEILPNFASFQAFYAGLLGSTFKATKQQFD
ncbi:MAG: hypothetical protein ACI9XO_003319 [Paraglaciecola sp.]